MEANLLRHGSIRKPAITRRARLGPPLKIGEEDAEALFGELIRSGWMYQDEMVKWLRIEREITVTQQAVSLFLKARGWSRRRLRPFSIRRNEELRDSYRTKMREFAAEDLVFLDEVI